MPGFGTVDSVEFNGIGTFLSDLYSGTSGTKDKQTKKEIKLLSGNNGVRFLLVSGVPIQEPVAWHGPIVMNTDKEIKQAMHELNNGTFIKQ